MGNIPKIYRGLEGIYVDTTSISFIDGEKGSLLYRGHSIEELGQMNFSEVVWLLLFGMQPKHNEKEMLENFLFEHSFLEEYEREILKNIKIGTHPMKMLQGMLPLLYNKSKGEWDHPLFDEELVNGLVLIAKIPSLIAAYYRLQLGEKILNPKKSLSFHENFLYQFNAKMPSIEEVKTLDITQILQLEHGFNASTFAARVTASTLAPIESAISSAIGTLFGRLHGGADQAALEMALEIGSLERVEDYILEALERREKIMGMGHRIYKVVDPRAKILKPMAKKICESTPFEKIYSVLERVEEIMGIEMNKKGKDIKANVEFYKGPVFYALGIPPQYFTSLFVMSRAFGYLAHIRENNLDNKLIRPKAFYLEKTI